MGRLAVWKVLEEMMLDFRRKSVDVPPEVMSDLKNARTTINILQADPSCSSAAQKVDEYLANVESFLVSEGHEKFGHDYVEAWMSRADEAGGKTDEEERARFVPGLPRGSKWIRVTPSAELPAEKVKSAVEEANLSYSVQKDGCLLVCGNGEDLRDFVKKIATKYGKKIGK